MTWDYSGNPGDTTRDTVRFISRDTDENDPLTLSNEEIEWLRLEHRLNGVDRPYTTAAAAVFSMMIRASRNYDSQSADVRRQRSQQAKQLADLYEQVKKAAEAVEGPSKLSILPSNLSSGGGPEDDGNMYFRSGQMNNPDAASDPEASPWGFGPGPGLLPWSR